MSTPVDKAMAAAYGRDAAARMAAWLRVSPERCARWLERWRVQGERLPEALPDGQPFPPATTPWARVDSPLPGVDLPVAQVRDLVAAAVAALARGPEAERRLAASLRSIVPSVRIDDARADALFADWFSSGAFERVRTCFVESRPRPGWLTDDEVAAFLRTSRDDLARRWRILLDAGCDARATWSALQGWSPARGVLPNGQWLPEDERAPGAAKAPSPLDAALDELFMELPFHAELLAHLPLEPSPGVEGFRLRGDPRSGRELRIAFDRERVGDLPRSEQKALLVHALNHLILGHRDGSFPAPTDPLQRRAWHIATECTANEFVPYPLPPEALRLEDFGMPRLESTTRRYQRAYEWLLRWPGALERGVVRPCRGCEDAPIPREAIAAALKETATRLGERAIEAIGPLAQHPELAAVLRPWLAERASLDWRAILRMHARELGAARPTRRYPSRRAPDRLGEVAGRRHARRAGSILLAIDTSGSLTEDDLAIIAAEAQAITAQGVRVGCVQCDTRIRDERWLAPGDRLGELHGRGGTDLRPPFAAEVREKYRPRLIVYFTDGDGPAPDEPPPGCAVLWVLTGRSPKRPARWGRAARLRASGEDDR